MNNYETKAGGTDAPRFDGDYNDEEHMDRIHSQRLEARNNRDFFQAFSESEKGQRDYYH